MMYKIILASVVFLFLQSCITKEEFMRMHGAPKYKVTLLDSNGNEVETKYAHSKIEAIDWGMNKNFEFTYWWFELRPWSKKYGSRHCETWEWDKYHVKVEQWYYKGR